MPSSLTINILQHSFTIPRRYQAGHVINEAEAQALNQVFIENVRNNITSWVAKSCFQHNTDILPDFAYKIMQDKIYNYASGYEFRNRSRTHKLTPLELIIVEVADEEAFTQANQHGLSFAERAELAHDLQSDPIIIQKARGLFEARKNLADAHLKEILP